MDVQLQELIDKIKSEGIKTAEQESARVLRDAWVRRALPLSRRIHLRQGGREFSGHVLDVNPAAGLVVQLDRGGRRLFDAASTSVVD